MKYLHILSAACLILFLLIAGKQPVRAQSPMPAVMDSAFLESQLDYVEENTRIYNGFRAIRNDIFIKMTGNAIDSLNKEKLEVARLNSEVTERDFQIETLNADLLRARNERDQAIRTKDNFTFLGIKLQKGVYNTIMWIIVLGLAGVVVLLFLMFKQSHLVTTQTKKELENIQEEYDNHRKTSREKYEKLVVSHHNEIMKLKNS
ncbi:MAG: hypothetical protein ABFS10_04545 [Bacteroidota bacterium]